MSKKAAYGFEYEILTGSSQNLKILSCYLRNDFEKHFLFSLYMPNCNWEKVSMSEGKVLLTKLGQKMNLNASQVYDINS